MLQELYIKNFGIFADERLTLQPGMTVFSGETGAGKSLVIGAIALILGARASLEDIRSGSDEACIEAVFDFAGEKRTTAQLTKMLQDAGVPLDEGRLVIRRILNTNGRNRIYINDQAVTLNILGRLRSYLIDLSSQHEYQVLLDSAEHLGVVDHYASRYLKNHAQLLTSYQQLFSGYRDLQKQKLDLEKQQATAAERGDFLQYRIRELQALNLDPAKDEALEAQVSRMQNSVKLFEMAKETSERLNESEGSILEQLGVMRKQIDRALPLDASLQSWQQSLQQAAGLLEDMNMQVAGYVEGLSFDPKERDLMEARLLQLSDVKRKYGSIRGAVAELEKMQQELTTLENVDADIQELTGRLEEQAKELIVAGEALTQSRKKAATSLQKAIERELDELAMEGARFAVKFLAYEAAAADSFPVSNDDEQASLGPDGFERLIFHFSANRGEALKPLNKVASGGELSRVMLAIKLILAGGGSQTFIFDEIDSGVGGRQAEVIGRKLKQLTMLGSAGKKSAGLQVLCVSHLAPIAAFAGHHVKVEKALHDQRTVAKTRLLSPKERERELARMLAGAAITSKTLAHAEEMLKNAEVNLDPGGIAFDPTAAI